MPGQEDLPNIFILAMAQREDRKSPSTWPGRSKFLPSPAFFCFKLLARLQGHGFATDSTVEEAESTVGSGKISLGDAGHLQYILKHVS